MTKTSIYACFPGILSGSAPGFGIRPGQMVCFVKQVA